MSGFGGEMRSQVHDAISELRGLRSTDPAAVAALASVRLTLDTLERWLVPLLEKPARP